ncbi:hypothetical protein Pint_02021 [Pistacia integerrima]|uniref:Uncharacterized protein n=1 Tax=Pistacia integerrima TaxID=434235 RepID=A0ACC0ZJH2_9ROSI|nr:hypothetical protein Pint_02021 [Pistacia integerrima]
MRVTLTVVRFQLAKDPNVDEVAEEKVTMEGSDDEYINEFRAIGRGIGIIQIYRTCISSCGATIYFGWSGCWIAPS